MAKGLIKDSTLTAIANAIREKTETTATMLPSEMAALIAGLPNIKMTYGSQTLASNTSLGSIEITHNLGVTPNVIFLAQSGNVYNNTTNGMAVSTVLFSDGTGIHCTERNKEYSRFPIGSDNISTYIPKLSSEKMTVSTVSGRFFKGTYYWLVGAI